MLLSPAAERQRGSLNPENGDDIEQVLGFYPAASLINARIHPLFDAKAQSRTSEGFLLGDLEMEGHLDCWIKSC